MTGHDGGAPAVQVLYEDNHLIAVVKPPGMLSQADETGAPDILTVVKADLKARYNKPGNVFLGLVHRLDRPAGGAMLLAKTSKAASRLSDAVRNRSFAKGYIACTEGVPSSREATLVHYLRKDAKTNIVTAYPKPVPDAKEAVLSYRVVAEAEGRALVAVRLHTGRPHQIRVQMAAIGCPLAGDRKYGAGEGVRSHDTAALWSAYIGVAHPVTKEWLEIRSLPPREGVWASWPDSAWSLAEGSFTAERTDR
ncbi:MAG: RNA pseudouridine synthase [Thermobacillus sp.]|uniref:RNA pseudouridylate synthase n=1 Tax=Thermobacillus composti (strain DSM 18247 / JCM 13945 / KWC4) TaxID=717605 RepID=L0EFI9_THECK|nr:MULTISPECIES: RNA pseudouridine synthase [Thermobacillus]AGA57910.1 23S RNA-specific pseudouridylate synthase [Thermobacillus composti KWC4]REK56844.1 MAG: RNA pseudouridine synthase [Thermobacillus sp.]